MDDVALLIDGLGIRESTKSRRSKAISAMPTDPVAASVFVERGVELEHRDLPEEEIRGHASGWTHYLARLQATVAKGDAGPDPGMASARPASASNDPKRAQTPL
jgi:hypothetical protein